jgi:site-specific DNA recombinase
MDGSLSTALYARVSSQRQADELTIRSQVSAIKQRIKEDEVTVEEELCFLDEGYSGSTLERPALERLRDVAYCGGIDRLYVHSPDRLARKYVYQVLLLEEFKKHGVDVVFLNLDPQNHSPEGDLLLQVQGMIAEYERAKILERTRRGRRFAARQGKVSAIGHAPYGYRYVRKQEGDGEARFDIVLDEARVVREIFTWVAVEGLSLGEVARRLSEQEVPTATSKARWDRATIRGILMNPAYTGTARYPKTRLFPRIPGRRPKRGDPRVPRQEKVSRAVSPEEQEPIRVPAIINREMFDAAAERLQENRRRHREQKQGAEHLLSGLLVCHCCGSAYCGQRLRRKASGPYVYYHCLGTDKYRHGGRAICENPSLPGSSLEESVWSDVCALLKDPGRLKRELERRLEKAPTNMLDTTQLQKSIAQLKQRIGRLIDGYENGWLDKSDFERRIQRAKERLAREEEILDHHQRESLDDEELRLVASRFETFAAQIADGLEHADFATRRRLLRLLVDRIEVDRDEVRIVYKVQPRPFAPSPASRGILQDCLKCHTTLSGLEPGVRTETQGGTPRLRRCVYPGLQAVTLSASNWRNVATQPPLIAATASSWSRPRISEPSPPFTPVRWIRRITKRSCCGSTQPCVP